MQYTVLMWYNNAQYGCTQVEAQMLTKSIYIVGKFRTIRKSIILWPYNEQDGKGTILGIKRARGEEDDATR